MKHSWFTFLLLEREFCEEYVREYDYQTIVRRGKEGMCMNVPCPPNAVCVSKHCIKCIYRTEKTVDEWKELVVKESERWENR